MADIWRTVYFVQDSETHTERLKRLKDLVRDVGHMKSQAVAGDQSKIHVLDQVLSRDTQRHHSTTTGDRPLRSNSERRNRPGKRQRAGGWVSRAAADSL